jgi:hypothetical protein
MLSKINHSTSGLENSKIVILNEVKNPDCRNEDGFFVSLRMTSCFSSYPHYIIFKGFLILLFFVFISNTSTSYSQNLQDTTKTKDSTKIWKTQEQLLKDTIKTTPYIMSKSPVGAILRSLALPGWGQVYVESYWKAPIFFAGAATLVYLIIWNNKKYNDEVKTIASLDSTKLGQLEYQVQLYNDKGWREVYRDNRDMSAFYLLGVYALAAIDAYVGAHLFDFNVDKDLSLAILPNRYRGFNFNLCYKWGKK